jgi:hypothetical protein
LASILDIKESDEFKYEPNVLFDELIQLRRLKNDAALALVLEVAPAVISNIRHKKLPVGATLLIRMHEESGLSIKDLRALMGDRRAKFKVPDTL